MILGQVGTLGVYGAEVTPNAPQNPTLKNVLSILSNTHMRSLAVSKEGLGFSNSLLPTLISLTNTATEELYNRFNLGYNQVKVAIDSAQATYFIDAAQDYIDDTVEHSLTKNISQIVSAVVHTKDSGEYGVDINNKNDYYTITSNSNTGIKVNNNVLKDCKEMDVWVVMLPDSLPLTTDASNLDLPLSVGYRYLEVLALCVAKLYYSSSGSKENVQKSGLLTQIYEQKVEELMNTGALQDINYFLPSEDIGEWP